MAGKPPPFQKKGAPAPKPKKTYPPIPKRPVLSFGKKGMC